MKPVPKKQRLDLSTFEDQLLDGLDFCRKVYDLFDQVRNGPDGIAKLIVTSKAEWGNAR
jgi:hypothetical protein